MKLSPPTKAGTVSAQDQACTSLVQHDAVQSSRKRAYTLDLAESCIGLFMGCGFAVSIDTEAGASRVRLPHGVRLLLSLLSVVLLVLVGYFLLSYLSVYSFLLGRAGGVLVWPLDSLGLAWLNAAAPDRVGDLTLLMLLSWSGARLDGRCIQAVFRSTALLIVSIMAMFTAGVLLFGNAVEPTLQLTTVFAPFQLDGVQLVTNLSVFMAAAGVLLAA